MDRIWNREGMDLRMMPYACLVTGSQVYFPSLNLSPMDLNKTKPKLNVVFTGV
jgi:hypothetical protein